MSYSLKDKIFWFALGSRIFTIALSSLSNAILLDHEPVVFKTPKINESLTILDDLIDGSLGGLTRWDAQYFLHISQHGYTYENTLAFFPLYPLLIRIVSSILYFCINQFISYYSTLILSAFLINLICFIKTVTILYELSLIVFKSKAVAYKAAIFYCVNPGNIFFTAFYSESCFAFFSFSGMLLLLNKKSWPAACLCFGLSCATRSNGILNLGFIAHLAIKHCLISKTVNQLIPFSLMLLVSIAPFIMFQLYAYSKYCFGSREIFSNPVKEYGRFNGYVFPGDITPVWCNTSFPLSYSYVQDHYWNVGFLRYFHWKQLPNFFLALPIIIIVLSKSLIILKDNKFIVFTLGFARKSKMQFNGYVAESILFVNIVHVVFLTLFCTFCIHVQVTTRMIASSSPVLYWFLAVFYRSKQRSEKPHDIVPKEFMKSCDINGQKELIECSENMQSWWKVFLFTDKASNLESQLLRTYLVVYIILGNIIFSNYYPWT